MDDLPNASGIDGHRLPRGKELRRLAVAQREAVDLAIGGQHRPDDVHPVPVGQEKELHLDVGVLLLEDLRPRSG